MKTKRILLDQEENSKRTKRTFKSTHFRCLISFSYCIFSSLFPLFLVFRLLFPLFPSLFFLFPFVLVLRFLYFLSSLVSRSFLISPFLPSLLFPFFHSFPSSLTSFIYIPFPSLLHSFSLFFVPFPLIYFPSIHFSFSPLFLLHSCNLLISIPSFPFLHSCPLFYLLSFPFLLLSFLLRP